jgi:hypothetical protein
MMGLSMSMSLARDRPVGVSRTFAFILWRKSFSLLFGMKYSYSAS